MNCEANGCTAALTPKAIPGSAADVAAGIPSTWVVTDIPPGWCVRQVENTDVGSSRVVVLCPLHGAGVARESQAERVTGRPTLKVVVDEKTGTAYCPEMPQLGRFPGPVETP